MGKYLQLAEQALQRESGVSVNEDKNHQLGAGRLARPTSYGEKSEIGELSPPVQVHVLRRRLLRESRDELRRAAGDDWAELSQVPAQLIAFASLEATRQIRESGAIPDSYIAITTCAGCKSQVPIFTGCPPEVQSCVWCINGLVAPPVPGLKK